MNYKENLENLLKNQFVPFGLEVTKEVSLDLLPENSKYHALAFSINNQRIIYRKAKVTPDRPGAFLTLWQRPSLPNTGNKPIPIDCEQLDFLFVEVQEFSLKSDRKGRAGIFIFPASILIEKKIVSSHKIRGKTAFRTFPPWSGNRGVAGIKVFSDSGKKTQAWQLPFFVEIDESGILDFSTLSRILKLCSSSV